MFQSPETENKIKNIHQNLMYRISGIIDSEPKYLDKSVQFHVQTVDNKRFLCLCPFFKVVQPGDCIEGFVTYDGSMCTFKYEPHVQIPIDENNIKLCFQRVLKIRLETAERVYSGIMELVKISQELENPGGRIGFSSKDLEDYLTKKSIGFIKGNDVLCVGA